MSIVFRLLALLAITVSPLLVGAQSTDFDLLRSRVVDRALEGTVSPSGATALAATLLPDGTWPDLDYRDTSRTGFQHGTHLNRMIELGRALRREDSPVYGSAKLRAAVHLALTHWLEKDYRSANWWWNQIGTPGRMKTLLLIMDESLTDAQRAAAGPIAGRANLGAWGARPGGDLIEIASILAESALFQRDTATFRTAVDAMAAEIQFAHRRNTPDDLRGLQSDYAFHHRGDRVTSILSYGLQYANAFAEWAGLLAGTDYQFPPARIQLLVDFYLEGIARSLAFGVYPDPGAKNRGLSRPGALRANGRSIPEVLASVTDYRRDDLLSTLSGEAEPGYTGLTGNRFYWNSEYMSQQTATYFASARLYSARNHSVEVPYNGEGTTFHYLGDGANWLTRRGDEYLDIFPLLDYRKIPGTTVVQQPTLPSPDSIQQRGLTGFVGGVSNGAAGAAAFDFRSPLDSLVARKGYFFFGERYACLGAGITSSEAYPVVTTLDQRWLDGSIITNASDTATESLTPTDRSQQLDWLWHDSVAYVFPTPLPVTVGDPVARGSWYGPAVHSGASRDTLTGEVFRAWIEHGTRPVDASYAYFVLPGVGAEAAGALAASPPLVVLRNDSEVQAVREVGSGNLQAIFYRAATLMLDTDAALRPEQACAMMIATAPAGTVGITVADPSRTLATLVFTIDGVYSTDHGGVTVTEQPSGQTRIEVNLPDGHRRGSSVQFGLKK